MATPTPSRCSLNFIAGEQCTVTIFKDAVHDVDMDDPVDGDTLPANSLLLYGGDGYGSALPSSAFT